MFGLNKLFGKPDATPNAAPTPTTATEAEASQAERRKAFLRREAIFNRGKRIVGHIYRLQHADAGLGDAPTRRQLPLDDLLLHSLEDTAITPETPAFVPLCSLSLGNPRLDQLPGESLVLLLVLAPENPDEHSLLPRILALKNKGFRFGVFRQPKHPAFAPVLAQADYGVIDLAANPGNSVRDFSVALRSREIGHALQLLAVHADSADDLQLCQACQFDLIHGAFAATDRDWATPKTDPHKMHLMHLLNLAQSDAETPAMVAALKQDPLLTHRILRYLNSAALGLQREITSLDQALTLLGRQRLARWLSVLLFAVRDPDFSDWLMVENALVRGRLMELLGQDRFPAGENDHLFLTGIFSNLDKLLGIPLAEAVGQARVPANVRLALLERSGPYANLLAVAEAGESLQPDAIRSCAEAAGLTPEAVNRALFAATAWASEMTRTWE